MTIHNLTARLPIRPQDEYGAGHLGAPRGIRSHRGEDRLASIGMVLTSPVDGQVTKIGWPYAGDEYLRYVQITDSDNRHWRVMYIEPRVALGAYVKGGKSDIGSVQDLSLRYPPKRPGEENDGSILNHIHLEVRRWDKKNCFWQYIDPSTGNLIA